MANKPNDSKSTTKSKGSAFLAALFRVLGTLILVTVLIVSIPASVPRLFGYTTYNIVSGSMAKVIPVGSAVFVKPVDPAYLEAQKDEEGNEIGHIIAYMVDDDVIVHRVIENNIEAHELITQGDNNDQKDMKPVPYTDCLGRVRVSVQFLGSILAFANANKLFVFLFIFAGIMFTILGKVLTPPDEFADEIISKSKTNNKASSAKSNTVKEESKTVSESVGTSKTITVDDAVNNNVDQSIFENEDTALEYDSNETVTLADIAGNSASSTDNALAKEETKVLTDDKIDNSTTESPKDSDKKETNKKNAEKDKLKKQLTAIVIIIIVLVVAFLGVIGYIVVKSLMYNENQDSTDTAIEQFTSTASDEEVVVDEEIVEDVFALHTTEKCPIDVDFESLWEVNPDICAWIYAEDTVINYPVLHGEDDDYYLHHSYEHKKTAAGSIFVDCNNMKDFSDVNSIIYGHHMKNGSMFAGLQKWEEQEYYDGHKYIWLITPEANYQVWIFSGYLTDAFSESYVGIRNWGDMAEDYITKAYNDSDFTPTVSLEDMLKCADDDQHYIMLSTCEYEFKNARYVIHGKLVKETPGVYSTEGLNGASDNDAVSEPEDNNSASDQDTELTDENLDDSEVEINFNNLAEKKQIINPATGMLQGEYSVHRFSSTKCNEDFLSKWYFDFVKQNKDYLWNVIYYDDKDDNTGIYASNGVIEKDVTLDADGGISDNSKAIIYAVSNNELTVSKESYIP